MRTPQYHSGNAKQRGAALMIMLVIMVMGAAAYLVSSLSRARLQVERDKITADALAQAKEVVIGYMLQGGAIPPGWMMVPDVLDVPSASEKSPTDNSLASNYDGVWESNCFNITKPAAVPPYTPLTGSNINKRCFGRLPWKSLGMSISAPSENDPTGYMPWYAFSRNLISASTPINSELLNNNPYPWLKVYDMNGVLLSARVAFVIIIPGAALSYQSRPPSPNLANPDQYLDKISLPAGCSPSGTPCTTTYKNYDLSETFITGAERRWVNDPSNPGKQIEDPTYEFNDKLLYVTIDELMPLIEKRIAREVKNCLDDYAAAASNTNHKYPWAALVSDSTPYPNRTGTYDVRFGRVPEIPNIDTTSGGIPDSTMPASWSTIPSCNKLIFTSSYWPDWRDLVFYQVADGYQPGSTGACISCLSISGSGNPVAGSGTYRAAVIVAGQKLPGQTRPSTNNPPDNYLEATGGNAHQSLAGTTPSVNFTTYKSSDTTNYSTVNDLVLCADGKNNCK